MRMFLTINLTNPSDRGGLAEYYRRVIPYICREFPDVCIFNVNTGTIDSSVLRQELFMDVPIFSLPVYNLSDPRDLSLILREILTNVINKLDIKVIVFPDYLFVPYLNFDQLKRKGVTTILFVHLLYRGLINSFSECRSPDISDANVLLAASKQELIAILNSDYIVTNSFFTEHEVNKYYESDLSCDVVAIQLGVDLEEWEFCPMNERCEIGYYGRLASQKGIRLILDRLDGNFDRHVGYPLHFAGSGSFEPEIIKAQRLFSSVKYHGNLIGPEVKTFLRPLKWVLVPSIYEPWGQVVTECLAMGKICLVSSRNSGLTEQIDHGINGFHFDFENGSFLSYIQELEGGGINFDLISRNARKSANDISRHVLNFTSFLNSVEVKSTERIFSPWFDA